LDRLKRIFQNFVKPVRNFSIWSAPRFMRGQKLANRRLFSLDMGFYRFCLALRKFLTEIFPKEEPVLFKREPRL